MEYLLVCNIVQHLMEDNWDWDNIHNMDYMVIYCTYFIHIKLTKLLQVDLALFQRTPKDIEKILTVAVIASKWEIFRQQNMVVKVFKKC